MVPDTKIPDLLTLPPLSAVDQGYVALKTPPPLVVRDELGPVPDPVRPGWGRLALLAALIFALVVAIGLLGTAYLRRPIDVSPEAAAHEDSARR